MGYKRIYLLRVQNVPTIKLILKSDTSNKKNHKYINFVQ